MALFRRKSTNENMIDWIHLRVVFFDLVNGRLFLFFLFCPSCFFFCVLMLTRKRRKKNTTEARHEKISLIKLIWHIWPCQDIVGSVLYLIRSSLYKNAMKMNESRSMFSLAFILLKEKTEKNKDCAKYLTICHDISKEKYRAKNGEEFPSGGDHRTCQRTKPFNG